MSKMAPPKKHKKRPHDSATRKKAGWRPVVGMTLDESTLLQLDLIAGHYNEQGYNLDSRSAVVRFLAKRESAKVVKGK